MAFKPVVKCAVVFDLHANYLFGFYSEEEFDRHMAEWNDPCNFDCMAFEVHPEVGCYLRDHCMAAGEVKTETCVINELD